MPILTFHALDDQDFPISFPPNLFKRGLTRLNTKGYRTISLEQATEHARTGKPFPLRASVITFDDGYQSVYAEAFPLLQEFHISSLPWVIDEVEATRGIIGPQIWDYSIEGSLPTLTALVTYLDEQKLSRRRMSVDELFVPNISPGLVDYLRATGEG